jgi:hypothetical protein
MFAKTIIALTVGVCTVSSALAATKQSSANAGWNVYDSRGVRIGSDPDPRVRSMLLHDQGAE